MDCRRVRFLHAYSLNIYIRRFSRRSRLASHPRYNSPTLTSSCRRPSVQGPMSPRDYTCVARSSFPPREKITDAILAVDYDYKKPSVSHQYSPRSCSNTRTSLLLTAQGAFRVPCWMSAHPPHVAIPPDVRDALVRMLDLPVICTLNTC